MFLKIEHFDTAAMETRDVTGLVQAAVAESGVQRGVCHITQVAATAGLWVCSKKPAAQAAIQAALEDIMPARADFHHRETACDAAGHIKALVAPSQLSLIVKDGRLLLGEEQAVVYAEFDGPRPRTLHIAVLADATTKEGGEAV